MNDYERHVRRERTAQIVMAIIAGSCLIGLGILIVIVAWVVVVVIGILG